MTQTIETVVDGPVATVWLDRPSVRNAFNAEMIHELTDAFDSLGRASAVRCVVLAGRGRAFSAGADVNWMRSSLEFTRAENIADAQRMSDMFLSIDRLSKPVIAHVHGAALGGGMGLMAVADIVVAADDTIFGFTETKLGVIPAVISHFVIPKIGVSWARALFLSGERFDASVAQQIGLVHWTTPFQHLDALVEAKVIEILSAGPMAALAAKRLIAESVHLDRDDQQRTLTIENIAGVRASSEGQEGLRAFLEKRKPAWQAEEPE